LVFISGASYLQFGYMDNSYTEMINDRTEKINHVTYSVMQAYREQMAIQAYIITGKSDTLTGYDEARATFKKDIENIKAITNAQEALDLIQKLENEEAAFYDIAKRMIDERRKGNLESATKIMENEAIPTMFNIENAAKELLLYQQEQIKISSEELSEATK